MDIKKNRLIYADELKRRIIAFATGCHTTYLTVDNIIMLLNQADTVDAVPAWIPVTERLPENNRPVMVYLKNYTIQGGYVVHIGTYDTAGFWFLRTQPGISSFPVHDWVVTHWMPLPEPPKDGDDNG